LGKYISDASHNTIKNVCYIITEVFDEMDIKSKFNTRFMHSKKTLALVSLLFMIALLSSPFISEFNGVAPFALGNPNAPNITTWEQLVAAVAAAPTDGTSYVIEIRERDLELKDTLEISSGKNITLVNHPDYTGRSLLGVNGKATITVLSGGELVLDGVIITHINDAKGTGVHVKDGGNFTMVSGQIFNNNVTGITGGGVFNEGNFRLSGGDIRNNTADRGGGVCNYGNFNVTGGTIRDNNARHGGGVYSDGASFRMTGGQISNNVVTNEGGGVSTDNDFTMTGGRISNNKADNGGGVASYNCVFRLSGGAVSFNTATNRGGGVFISDGNMSLTSDGMIFNNTAASNGGGVFSNGKVFDMNGGLVSNNTAIDGGGIYVNAGDFNMDRGTIANNTATRNGGGIGVPNLGGLERIDIRSASVFSNNRAATAYNRSSTHDNLYNEKIGRSVTWSFTFTQGYNNFDIQYTAGTQIDNPTNPGTSPTATATTTATATPPESTKTPTPTPAPPETDNLFWVLVVVIILVACLIIAVMFFYFRKNNTQQVAPDWIDSTPPPRPADFPDSSNV